MTSSQPVLSFSLANASAAGFIRWQPGPQLTAVVSCGNRGPFEMKFCVLVCTSTGSYVVLSSCMPLP